jgi:uncharacterized protein
MRKGGAMAHPNEELVRKGFDAFSKGDLDTVRALFDPDAVWHAPGRSRLSGDHRGVDDILDFFARTMELTAGTFRVDLHDVIANDEHAVAMYVARGEREGRTLEDKACSSAMSATASSWRRGSTPRISTPPTSSFHSGLSWWLPCYAARLRHTVLARP